MQEQDRYPKLAHDSPARAAMLMAVALLAGIVACSSSKVLNESRVRDLIADEIKRTNGNFMISVSEVEPYMTRTRKDYTSSTVTSGPEFILKQLLERKLVVQRQDSVSYPRIAGRFVYSNASMKYEFDLEPTPDSNTCTGTRYSEFKNMAGRMASKLNATVAANGSVHITKAPTGLMDSTPDFEETFQYHEEGGAATLRSLHGDSVFTGPATGQKLELKWYEYSFSPELAKQIVHDQHGPFVSGPLKGDFVPGGAFVLGEVSDLQLLLDTHAAANIAWQVSPNDLARIFLGSEKPAGKTEVHFVKKPDGTWVVAPEGE
jgi:hypothetical protein